MADGLFNSLIDKYKNSVDMRKRVYGESLLKSFTNTQNKSINESDFTEKELKDLDTLIKEHYQQKLNYFNRPKKELLNDATMLEKGAKEDLEYAKTLDPKNSNILEKINNRVKLRLTEAKQLREAAQGQIPTDFSFQYTGYGDRVAENKFTKDPSGWAQTLGRFRYKINPETGEYRVYDTYDFNNDVHKYAADRYAQMNPIQRMASALADTALKNNQYALGEAYLSGKNSIPVEIIRKQKQEQQQQPQVESLGYTDPFGFTIK